MKKGDRVIIKHPSLANSDRFFEWQVWEVIALKRQATGVITRLRGVCVPAVECAGYSPDNLVRIR